MRLHERGELREARDAARHAAKAFRALDGPRSPDVAHALMIAASAAVGLGRNSEALAAATRACAILSGLRDPSNHDLTRLRAQALACLGGVRIARGEYSLARDACRRALTVATPLGGDDVVSALNGLAVVYKALGRWDDAEPLYRRALRMARRLAASRGTQADIASILHNLGGLEHARGRYARGIRHARSGLAIRERERGKAHLEVAADAAALAALLEGAGERRDARRLYRRALAIYEKKLGPEHFEIGFNLANLAALEHGAGRYALAEQLYQRALAIEVSALGRYHPYVATALRNLAALREDQGRAAEQRRLLERAHRIFIRTLGPRHPDTVECARASDASRAQRDLPRFARNARTTSSRRAVHDAKRKPRA